MTKDHWLILAMLLGVGATLVKEHTGAKEIAQDKPEHKPIITFAYLAILGVVAFMVYEIMSTGEKRQ